MKRALALIGILLAGLWAWNAYEHNWRAQLQASPTLTLYSIDPHREHAAPTDAKIDRFRVLGQTTLRGAELQTAVDAAESASNGGANNASSCIFAPRVALESEDKKTRLLLCFTCGEAKSEVLGVGRYFNIYGRKDAQGKAAEGQLNALLRRAHVPIAPIQW